LPNIIIGQEFYVLLSIDDPGFQNVYYPNLTQVIVMGNGTTFSLDID